MDPSRRSFLKGVGATLLAGAAITFPLPQGLEAVLESITGINLSSTAEARASQQRASTAALIRRGYDVTIARHGIADLETQISSYISYLREHGVIPASEETSFYVYDIEKAHAACSINIDASRMAASLIKPFVMAAAYDTARRSGTSLPRSARRDIRRMIQHSSNDATNRVIEFVGGVTAVQASIDGMHLFSATRITETIPPGGRTYQNRTSAHDLNILLNQLHHGAIVSREASREMLGILDGYQTSRIDERILPLRSVRNLIGKTGVVYGMNGEATIVDYVNKAGQQRPFIFTAIFEDRTLPESGRRDASWVPRRSEIMRRVAQLTVRYYERDLVEYHRGSAERESRIAEAVRFYQQRPDFIANARERGQQYDAIIRRAARSQGLSHEDIYALLFVESGFQRDVQSPTGPVGIAQFASGTAREAGLHVTKRRDDRQHPGRAIRAAARLLRDYRDIFAERYTNSPSIAMWNAIAAYQRGINGMRRDLDAAGEVSYWHLPGTAEERQYVPRVLAVKQLVFGS